MQKVINGQVAQKVINGQVTKGGNAAAVIMLLLRSVSGAPKIQSKDWRD